LTSTGKKLLKSIEAADSIVLDPHKSLFLPYGSGVILIKNGAHMKKTFSDTAAYFQDLETNDMNVSPADLSIELTRPFRGLRMWLPLKIHDLAPFKAALNEKLILSKYFYEQILAHGFQSSGPPQLTITTFWYPMNDRGDNEFNKRLIQNIQQEGQILPSSTMIENRFVIRLCVLVFRTHKREIDIAINNTVQHKDQLLKTWQ
jgi:aromatic-L-amino-acid/L-tryptophan decarboxylase|tara:strand:+ start:316 stop:924 length:609 start_codon:yes stop_codon:yes gene_type:complete